MARQFNVSRATLRKALRVLASQHPITKVPGARGGNFVQTVDHQSLGRVVIESVDNPLALGTIEFDEVAAVRQLLEAPSVRLAADSRGDDYVRQLQEIVQSQRTASVDDPAIPDLDRQLHTRIAQASGDRGLSSFVEALHHATEPVHYLDLSPEVGRETVKQHQAIVRAIEERDADASEGAIIEHLRYLRRHLAAHPDGWVRRRQSRRASRRDCRLGLGLRCLP